MKGMYGHTIKSVCCDDVRQNVAGNYLRISGLEMRKLVVD